MAKSHLKAGSIFLILAIVALLTGCKLFGSKSSSSSSLSSSTVEGIATPSSVSVVTANNAD